MTGLAAALPLLTLSAALLFCRIAGCLMVVPVFGSSRIAPQVRLFLALAVTLALSPMLLPLAAPVARGLGLLPGVKLLTAEIATGIFFGILARMFFAMLEMIAKLMADVTGLNGPEPGPEDEYQPAMTSLLTLAATTVVVLTDAHLLTLRALVSTYETVPLGAAADFRLNLTQLAETLREATQLAARIGAPFILYGVLANFAVAVLNKMMPAMPVTFIATPFLLAGGLLLLLVIIPAALQLFAAGYATWLSQ